MTAKVLAKEEFKAFVDGLIKTGRVVGAKKKDNKFAFGDIASSDELVMDYDVTLRSPRVYFQPPKEELLKFEKNGSTKVEATIEAQPLVVLGIHTYDLKALNQMDRIFKDKYEDENYLARRDSATVIALEPTKASKWSFWSWMDATNVDTGFDLLLTDVGDRYVVEVGTEKGAALLAKHAPKAADSSDSDLKAREEFRSKLGTMCNADREVKVAAKDLPGFMDSKYENPIWEKQAEKCYSCGSCNLVCPTCYCFDVKDEIELDLKHGSRSRTWDGCLLSTFAEVGSGENFREHRSSRFRHRIFRKTVYMDEKIGEIACVGCGRCSETCLPNITDPVKIINELKEGN